jgi:hypothetical protein
MRNPGFAVDNRHIMTGLSQEIGRCYADNTGAKNRDMHDSP